MTLLKRSELEARVHPGSLDPCNDVVEGGSSIMEKAGIRATKLAWSHKFAKDRSCDIVIATKVAAGMEVRRLKVIRVVSSTTTSSLPISSAFILIPHPLQSLAWALSPDTEWKAHA
ncbi:hypothetical protein CK203_076457 [Vitis vinifera]|uniref:Uncharacterized protein n=1 Tax=Vitis vinifera TaxID=29760 RepID=A0A438C0M6_VITVI|nr:hypothetical protein CK203_076457 [Vitis vinifera]